MSYISDILIPFRVVNVIPVGLASGYEMLLVDLENFKVNVKLRWYKEAITKLVIGTKNGRKVLKKIILAKEFQTHYFLPGDISSIIYTSKQNELFIPQVIEFSYASLNSPKFCTRGLVMLTSMRKCPLTADCPYYEPETFGCRHFAHYEGLTYAELFEVKPNVQFEGEYDIVKTILCLLYKGIPLVKISEVYSHGPLLYVDRVVIRNRLRPAVLCFVLEPKYKIGYFTGNVSGLLLTYYRDALQTLVERVLSNEKTRTALERNYCLLKDASTTFTYASIIRKMVDDLRSIDHYMILQRHRDVVFGRDFIDFCECVMAHLITHFLLNYLCRTTDVSIDDVYHSLKVTEDKVKIIVIGNPHIMSKIIDFLKRRPVEILKKAVNDAIEATRGERAEELTCELEAHKRTISRIIRVINRFIEISGYLPYPTALWAYINLRFRRQGVSESTVDKLISYIINTSHTRGYDLTLTSNCCYDLAFQWALFNPKMLHVILNELEPALIDNGVVHPRIIKETPTRLVSRLLDLSDRRVHIITGRLSSSVIKRYLKPHLNRGINIDVTTGILFKSKKHKAVLRERETKRLKVTSLSKYIPNYTLIIIDEVIALVGYWNLTNTSLKSSDAFSLLFYNPRKVEEIINYLRTSRALRKDFRLKN